MQIINYIKNHVNCTLINAYTRKYLHNIMDSYLHTQGNIMITEFNAINIYTRQ